MARISLQQWQRDADVQLDFGRAEVAHPTAWHGASLVKSTTTTLTFRLPEKPASSTSSSFTLEKALELGLQEHEELIASLSTAAAKELAIEESIAKVELVRSCAVAARPSS